MEPNSSFYCSVDLFHRWRVFQLLQYFWISWWFLWLMKILLCLKSRYLVAMFTAQSLTMWYMSRMYTYFISHEITWFFIFLRASGECRAREFQTLQKQTESMFTIRGSPSTLKASPQILSHRWQGLKTGHSSWQNEGGQHGTHFQCQSTATQETVLSQFNVL